MAQGFLGLNTALSGLFANQRNLGVVSHNVANVHTEGYSRQRMNTHAYKPQVLVGGKGTLGTGVDMYPVEQIRDQYLDYKLRAEDSILGEWEAKAQILTEIEGIFNEPSNSSISELLNRYYESLQTLSKNPENLTARTLVRQNAIAVVEGVKAIHVQLQKLQEDLNFKFKAAVGEMNSYAEQIVALNKVIYKAELEGGKANDIRDQRNLLVDKMSKFAKINYYEDDKNRFYVTVGGHHIVSHYRADTLKMIPREKKLHSTDSDGIEDILWQHGNQVYLTTGQLNGLLEARDGFDGTTKGVPYYLDRLTEFIDTFAGEMNRLHEKGFGLDGSTGNYMFTIAGKSTQDYKKYVLAHGLDEGPAIDVTASVLVGTDGLTGVELENAIRVNKNKILAKNPQHREKSIKLIDGKYYIADRVTAHNLSISEELEDVNKLAASKSKAEIPGDNSVVLDMVATRFNVKLYDWGAPEDFVKSLVSNLGVDSSQAQRKLKNQQLLVKEYNVARDSAMGVSLDEEISNMIKFQTAYNANARMVNVFDEMLDLVVNRLGIVGR